MIKINGNKKKWKAFDIILWDHDIIPDNVNEKPENNSNVIEDGIYFTIKPSAIKRFERLAKKNNFDFEYRK